VKTFAMTCICDECGASDSSREGYNPIRDGGWHDQDISLGFGRSVPVLLCPGCFGLYAKRRDEERVFLERVARKVKEAAK